MNKALSLWVCSLLATSALITGCVDDSMPNPKPLIDFNPNERSTTVAPGDSVEGLVITVSSTDNLKAFTIIRSDSAQPLQEVNSFSAKSYSTRLRDKIAASRDSGDQVVYTFTAITEKNETTTRTYTILVD